MRIDFWEVPAVSCERYLRVGRGYIDFIMFNIHWD